MIIGPHDEQAIFDGNGDDQRPEDQRETAERRLRGKVSTGRADDGLQRVERAGSEVTIDDPQCRECRRWCGLASDACQLCVPNIRFSMDAENRRGKFAT